MKKFIARIGYMLMWWLGTPEYSQEEAFEQYYILGFLITILGIVSMVLLTLLIIWEFKKNRCSYMKEERIYARDNLVNLGKKGKIKYWYDCGVYIGHCPLCSEVAYEPTHCVFCGCEFEEPTKEEIRIIKEANNYIEVKKGNITLRQVCNSLYEFRDGNLVSHSTLYKPLTKEELEKMIEEKKNEKN